MSVLFYDAETLAHIYLVASDGIPDEAWIADNLAIFSEDNARAFLKEYEGRHGKRAPVSAAEIVATARAREFRVAAKDPRQALGLVGLMSYNTDTDDPKVLAAILAVTSRVIFAYRGGGA